MNATTASSAPPSSSDEDRENTIILTPASTTVSDEGELASASSPSASDDIRVNDNDNDHTTSHSILDNDDNDNDNDNDDDNDDNDNDNDNKSSRFGWTATAFGRSQGLLTQVGSLSKELTELKAMMIARGAPSGSGVSEEQAEVCFPRHCHVCLSYYYCDDGN